MSTDAPAAELVKVYKTRAGNIAASFKIHKEDCRHLPAMAPRIRPTRQEAAALRLHCKVCM